MITAYGVKQVKSSRPYCGVGCGFRYGRLVPTSWDEAYGFVAALAEPDGGAVSAPV